MRTVGATVLRFLGALACALPVSTLAAEPPPFHTCTAPIKRQSFATKAQLDNYRAEVDAFRTCIEKYVKEQEAVIEVHRQAAQTAIDDWNKFIGPDPNRPVPKSSLPEKPGSGPEFREKP